MPATSNQEYSARDRRIINQRLPAVLRFVQLRFHFTIRQAARQVHLHPSTAYKRAKGFLDHGVNGLLSRTRPGPAIAIESPIEEAVKRKQLLAATLMFALAPSPARAAAFIGEPESDLRARLQRFLDFGLVGLLPDSPQPQRQRD